MNVRTPKMSFLIVLMMMTLLMPVHVHSDFLKMLVTKLVCGLSCHTACKGLCNVNILCHPLCAPACRIVCNVVAEVATGRKKRSLRITSTDLKKISEDPRFHGAFPSSLSSFDANKDGKISMDEFTKAATGGTRADPGTKEAFALSDKNGDKYIDCQEFKISPLKFDKKPSC